MILENTSDNALVDMVEYEKTQATIKLLSKLAEAEAAVKNGDEWLSIEEAEKNWECSR
ncbi:MULTISPECIES: hypothetical protein [Pelosinus]|jgi:hypothetical protein|uniref:Antitoxin n=1 Tax=Pelosinus fermentans B4 TaxID=1149862 RepID=I8RF52_9FIRM|nr:MULTISPECIES: hypothetical protein [Pelosinus]EIW16255.1 hypothetical protein FB4_0766 [Pelosinus fermentans B4]EIW22764.1 hypothetical protein FA11_0347 [Pelosinus fermentans A11]OAM95562.1 hypothetical protein FR7_03583 [Pelosinus fermentans DSM 17108]SDR29836.1 hypothetical protein SAMN04515679_3723 [Pelosinus fermentans]